MIESLITTSIVITILFTIIFIYNFFRKKETIIYNDCDCYLNKDKCIIKKVYKEQIDCLGFGSGFSEHKYNILECGKNLEKIKSLNKKIKK